jgi:hypothetical protein
VDGRILDLPAPCVPAKEPMVYHIAQERKVLAVCNPEVPAEDVIVRLLLRSGIRRAASLLPHPPRPAAAARCRPCGPAGRRPQPLVVIPCRPAGW